jgi:hypothetical protein
MKEQNNTLKLIAGIGALGGVIFLGYNYYKRKSDLETIKSLQVITKSDSINSAKPLVTVIDEVKELLKKDPKSKSYTTAEYKNMADSLYAYFTNRNYSGLVSTFEKMKTNTDLMLLSIYYAVRVFKFDAGNFAIKSYNLGQSINNMTTPDFRMQLQKILKNKNITYQLF